MREFTEKEFAINLDDAIGVLEKLQSGMMKFIQLLRDVQSN